MFCIPYILSIWLIKLNIPGSITPRYFFLMILVINIG